MKKEIEIIVPETWADVSLKTYQKYNSRISNLEDVLVLNRLHHLYSQVSVSDLTVRYDLRCFLFVLQIMTKQPVSSSYK